MKVFKAERLYPGPKGQHYPRELAQITADFKAEELTELMRSSSSGAYIGVSRDCENSIYISITTLKENKIGIIMDTFKKCVNELMS